MFRAQQREGDGRVVGYQYELDPSERSWSGGIYDESRRGWIANLENNEAARNAIKLDDWNEVHIETRGASLKTWINGVPAVDIVDGLDSEGFIALQVHEGEQGQIRWRNIRIQEHPVKAKPGDILYNGIEWEKDGLSRVRINDSVITGLFYDTEEDGELVESAYRMTGLRQLDDAVMRLTVPTCGTEGTSIAIRHQADADGGIASGLKVSVFADRAEAQLVTSESVTNLDPVELDVADSHEVIWVTLGDAATVTVGGKDILRMMATGLETKGEFYIEPARCGDGEDFTIPGFDWVDLNEAEDELLFYQTLDNEPAKVLSPEEALESFVIAPGFEVELVAAEPLVEDPVAMSWDEYGRLYVVEMRSYMPDAWGNGKNEPIGQVVRLEDTDGDGQMDTSEVFLGSMVNPRAVAVINEGVLIGEPPNLWLCELPTRDSVCTNKTSVGPYADNFETGNVEHLENRLLQGMDNWLYNSKSARKMRLVDGQMQSQESLDRGQWGISKDNYGRLFYNHNGTWVQADYFAAEDITLGNTTAEIAGLGVNLTDPSEVFSVRVNPGVNRAYLDGTLREDGRLHRATGVSGIAVYRGDQFPASYQENIFVPEVAGNVVARFSLVEEGMEVSVNQELYEDAVWGQRDFMGSTDERFRPVDAMNGPDDIEVETKAEIEETTQVQPLSPEDSLATMIIQDGYIMELVAAEPMVEEPVLLAYDGNGRMYVAEMLTYMLDVDGTGQMEPTSRIKRLEDTDGDGEIDSSSIFADGLLLPRMIQAVGDGQILVRETNTLDLLLLTDTDADGVADERTLVYEGGPRGGNLEHQPSGLVYNIDNWMYVTYTDRRYKFDGEQIIAEPIPIGLGQWGLAQDATGRLYYSAAGGEDPAFNFQFPSVYGKISIDGEKALGFNEVFPISTVPDVQGGLLRVREDGTLNHFTGGEHFTDYRDLVDSGLCDAVLIATPTMSHLEMGLYALNEGLHVLTEKPLGLSIAEGEQLLAAADSDQVFALMLNQRVAPVFAKMKALMDADTLGNLQRTHWTMTNWFRPEVYFQVSDWRATWRGEGGGLLVNQCIHNIDIFQWLTGMPVSVQGFCGFGKYHDIEVEDEATAYLEYSNGASGIFVGSTGEAPGVNRLDIVGDKGMLSFDAEQEATQREIKELEALAQKPWLKRMPTYLRLSGPGWLQGAMTLGGGSAVASLTIGAVYGYELLWVQPLSMFIGCIMLFALSHQTLSTGMAPFEAMRKYIHPGLAWAWALAALASSIIWGFSHYPLSAGMLEEIVQVGVGFDLKETGGLSRDLYLLVLAILVWCVCAYTAWNYGGGGRAIKWFENSIKLLSGMIILSFAWVVVSTSFQGKIEWGAVFAGYIPRSLPTDAAGVTTIMAALGTAVGINMTFIYGYTLLHRNWGRAHRELSRYDIVMGLVVPYILVTSLISIAAAGAFFGSDMDIQGKLSPAQAGLMFADVGLGPVTGRLIFAFEPVVAPGEFKFAAAFLDHGHIYGQCNGLRDAGAELKWVFDTDRSRIEKFVQTFPGVQIASSFDDILNDDEVKLVASAAVPSQRADIGAQVLQADKDYFTDKSPFTSLQQLEDTRDLVESGGGKYLVYYAERLHNDAAWRAGELIEQGAIGQVIQVEQFLTYAGCADAQVNFARVANMANTDKPGLEDFGELSLTGDNGASFYSRVDWFTPEGSADLVILLPADSAKPLMIAAEDLQADLALVLDASIVIVDSTEAIPAADIYFLIGQISQLSEPPLSGSQLSGSELLDASERQALVDLNPGARGSLIRRTQFQGSPMVVLTGEDIQGSQYAVYEYSEQVLGLDSLAYWTGSKAEPIAVEQLTDFDNQTIAPPVVPLLVYFENDVDELANLKEPMLEYDWESFTEMIDALVRMKYNGIEFFDMLGRTEFYTRAEYVSAYPDYQLDVEYLEKMMAYVHDKGMLIQIDMMQGRQMHTMSEAASTCWTDYKQEWIDGWRYYLTETPIRNIDIFALRPRNQVWDWEYKSTCGEDKATVFNEVYAEFNKIINEFDPDAPRVCICYHDGMEIFNEDFSPPKDFIIAWSDDGFGRFKYQPEDTKGYKFGTYMHAGFWLNHDVMDPYPELVDSIMTEMFERYDARHYMEVNGQTFRPFLLNIEAYADFAVQGTAFEGEAFYREWTTRYFGEQASPDVIQALKLLHEANKDGVGYVEILWQVKNFQAYLADVPARRPGRGTFVVELSKIQDYFEGTKPRIEALEQALEYVERAKSVLGDDHEFFHDHIELPIRIYLDLLLYNQTLIDLVVAKEARKVEPVAYLEGWSPQQSDASLAELLAQGRARLEQIYARRLAGDKNPKWATWYDPAKRRPNNGFPTLADFDQLDLALTSGGGCSNSLTPEERDQGWRLLFDGESLDQWRTYQQETVSGWGIENGCLTRTGEGGDLISLDQFADFELRLEWRISEAGNSGIFIRGDESGPSIHHTGFEMQVLDNAGHPDAAIPSHVSGSYYDMIAPDHDTSTPAGLWNQVRIVADGPRIQYWLNEFMTAEFELGSEEWKALYAQSKFSDRPNYGTLMRGHIGFQDHQDKVWLRNIRILQR
eukprot:g16947.t1